MSSKHTPGPWFHTGEPGDGKRQFVESKGDNWNCLRAEIDSDDCNYEMAVANARLIAAAPCGHAIALWALDVCKALKATDLYHVTMTSDGRYLEDAVDAYLSKVGGMS